MDMSDHVLVMVSLTHNAARLRRLAASRKYAGPAQAHFRADLRLAAHRCDELVAEMRAEGVNHAWH